MQGTRPAESERRRGAGSGQWAMQRACELLSLFRRRTRCPTRTTPPERLRTGRGSLLACHLCRGEGLECDSQMVYFFRWIVLDSLKLSASLFLASSGISMGSDARCCSLLFWDFRFHTALLASLLYLTIFPFSRDQLPFFLDSLGAVPSLHANYRLYSICQGSPSSAVLAAPDAAFHEPLGAQYHWRTKLSPSFHVKERMPSDFTFSVFRHNCV